METKPWWTQGTKWGKQEFIQGFHCEFGAFSRPLFQDEHLPWFPWQKNRKCGRGLLEGELKSKKSWNCCFSCPPYSTATSQCFNCIVYRLYRLYNMQELTVLNALMQETKHFTATVIKYVDNHQQHLYLLIKKPTASKSTPAPNTSCTPLQQWIWFMLRFSHTVQQIDGQPVLRAKWDPLGHLPLCDQQWFIDTSFHDTRT